ncbi:MAG: hypothetical protein V7K77_26715, partial [Nostoc sp.]|uniref:hypothetical protein n=1 Tax=Nostoc sp. TaxID=1180 RepID=UPI002FF7BC5D
MWENIWVCDRYVLILLVILESSCFQLSSALIPKNIIYWYYTGGNCMQKNTSVTLGEHFEA